jgi:hypothetical protein
MALFSLPDFAQELSSLLYLYFNPYF